MPTDANKVTISVTVEPETAKMLEEFANNLGASRSAVVNMLLKGTLSGDPSEVFSTMAKQAIAARKEQKGKLGKSSQAVAPA